MKQIGWLGLTNSIFARFGFRIDKTAPVAPMEKQNERQPDREFAGTPDSFMKLQREKWKTVPFTQDNRASSEELLLLDDKSLFEKWERVAIDTSAAVPCNYMRSWYQLIYRDYCRGRKIIDIGCGLGIDGIYFARNGARVTFIDIIPTNIELVRRICRYLQIESSCQFLVLNDVSDLDSLPSDYDAVMGFGSLMNAPLSIMKPEFDRLVARLKPEGSRFVMHAYPRSRWLREGALPFTQWGVVTDGENTPWVEWYEADKLIEALRPARFELVFSAEYRNGDMNCIDLVRINHKEPALPEGARLVEGSPDLVSMVSHKHWDGASLEFGARQARVKTGAQCWSYAAEIPLPKLQLPVDGGKIFLKVTAHAVQGEAGIGVLDSKAGIFPAEVHFSPSMHADTQIVEIPYPSELTAVVVRNRERNHMPSEVVIDEIGLYVVPPR